MTIDQPIYALGSTVTLGGLEQQFPITGQVHAWLYLCAEPSGVPYRLKFNTPPNDPSVTLSIGPSDYSGIRLDVQFTVNGVWIETEMSTYQRTTMFSARHGYQPAAVAHHCAIQAETDNSNSGWAYWRAHHHQMTTSQAQDDHLSKIREINRRYTTLLVRADALEDLANQHPDQFNDLLEGHKVARALSSDWYPDPKP